MIRKAPERYVTPDQIKRDLGTDTICHDGQYAVIATERLDTASLLYAKAVDLYGQDAVCIYDYITHYSVRISFTFAIPPIVRDIARAISVDPNQVIPDRDRYTVCYGSDLEAICFAYNQAMCHFAAECVSVEQRKIGRDLCFYLIIKPYASS